MPANLDILITNDDGYTSKGIAELVSCMRQFGRITVVAPKYPQSGMSVALTLGRKAIAYRKVREGDGVSWSYVDGTPASCGVNPEVASFLRAIAQQVVLGDIK